MVANIVAHAGLRTMNLPIPQQKYCPLGFQALDFGMLQSLLYQQQAVLQSANKRDHSKMKNENVKKSLEKSKNVLEEKCKKGQAKNLLKKDQHVYSNCYELRSRAINQATSVSLFSRSTSLLEITLVILF